MSMDRREFTKFLALIAAGAAAMPEQIAAFEKYYDRNTIGETGLVAIDEIMMSGIANKSLPVIIDLLYRDELQLPGLGCNLFGGIVRYLCAPDQKIVRPIKEMTWRITAVEPVYRPVDKSDFRAHISYIDQDGIRAYRKLDRCEGRLDAGVA